MVSNAYGLAAPGGARNEGVVISRVRWEDLTGTRGKAGWLFTASRLSTRIIAAEPQLCLPLVADHAEIECARALAAQGSPRSQHQHQQERSTANELKRFHYRGSPILTEP